jgi:hypothetical protein
MNRFLTTILSAFLLTSCPALAQTTAQPAAPKLVPIYTSKTYVAPNTKIQNFQDSITLGPGQENSTLELVVDNGPNGRVPFNWFRINIAGYLMASEQDMRGKRQAVIDVTGRMQPGTSQVLIEAAGEPNATLVWQVYTVPVQLTSVEPTNAQTGQTVVLVGKNFSADESQDKVFIGGQSAQILSASPTSITARVPNNAKPGTNAVQVVAAGNATRVLSINVGAKPIPVLHSMNYWMAPPGAVLTIKGDNFSPNAADNKVFFKNVSAQVVSASSNTLQVIIPNWGYGPQEMNIPVWVTSGGTRSGNYLPFDIGPKYLGALPPMPGDASSEASSESSSEASPWPMSAVSESSSQASSQAASENGSEASNEQGSEAGSEAPGPMILP